MMLKMYLLSQLAVFLLVLSQNLRSVVGVTDTGLMKIRLSPNSQETSGKLSVPFRECGYVFCEAPDVETDDSKHYWDYYIDWEIPSQVQGESNVFILANKFQMPRSYLVFKGFNANYTGEYKCILQFREEPVAVYTLTVTQADSVSSRNCLLGNR